MGQFYAAYQESHESIPQFIIRFQNLRKKLTRPPSEKDLKETFLTTLQEPLRSTLAVLDFKVDTLEQVIDRVLNMDKAQNDNAMSM